MRTVMVDEELAALVEREMPLKVSAGKACELLGLERLDFVRRAGELGVPVYLTTRTFGRTLGLEIVGTGGVLSMAKVRGLIPAPRGDYDEAFAEYGR